MVRLLPGLRGSWSADRQQRGSIVFLLDVEVEAADARTAESYLRARIRLPDGWSLRSVAIRPELLLRPRERAEGEQVWLNPAIPAVDNHDIEQGSHGVVEQVERMGLRRPRYLVRFDNQRDGTLRGWVIAEELFADSHPPGIEPQ